MTTDDDHPTMRITPPPDDLDATRMAVLAFDYLRALGVHDVDPSVDLMTLDPATLAQRIEVHRARTRARDSARARRDARDAAQIDRLTATLEQVRHHAIVALEDGVSPSGAYLGDADTGCLHVLAHITGVVDAALP